MTGPWSGYNDPVPTPDVLEHMRAAVKRNMPRRMSAKRRRQLAEQRASKKRVARLKCVVFLTENPDVKRFFRIIPRYKRL